MLRDVDWIQEAREQHAQSASTEVHWKSLALVRALLSVAAALIAIAERMSSHDPADR